METVPHKGKSFVLKMTARIPMPAYEWDQECAQNEHNLLKFSPVLTTGGKNKKRMVRKPGLQ